jgi:hypothetical protein
MLQKNLKGLAGQLILYVFGIIRIPHKREKDLLVEYLLGELLLKRGNKVLPGFHPLKIVAVMCKDRDPTVTTAMQASLVNVESIRAKLTGLARWFVQGFHKSFISFLYIIRLILRVFLFQLSDLSI